MKTVALKEILNEEQLTEVERLVNSTPDQTSLTQKLRVYLAQFKEELEAKGVVGDYLAYVLAYKLYSGGDNGERLINN